MNFQLSESVANNEILKNNSIRQEDIGYFYFPYQKPPNFIQAEAHRKATKFAKNIETNTDNRLFDPQSKLFVDKQNLSLWASIEDIAKVNPGYGLYFETFKFLIIVVVTLIILSIPIFVLYGNGDYCSKKHSEGPNCTLSFFTKFTFLNYFDKLSKLSVFVDLYCLFYIFVLMLLCLAWRCQFKVLNKKYNYNYANITHYSLLIHNLPKKLDESVDMRNEIKQYFENMQSKTLFRNFIVKEVVLTYDLNEYDMLVKKYNKCMLQKDQILSEDELNMLLQQITDFEKNVVEGKPKNFAGAAFVTFETIAERDELIKRSGHLLKIKEFLVELGYRTTPYLFQLKDTETKYVYFKKAIPPEDIIWNGFGFTLKSQILRRLLTLLICIIILSISLALNVMLKYGKIKLLEYTTDFKLVTSILMKIIFTMSIIIIMGTNLVIIRTLSYVCRINKYMDVSKQNYRICKYSTISVVINNTLVPVILSYRVSDDRDGLQDTVIEFTTLTIVQSLVLPLMILLQKSHKMKISKQKAEQKKGANCHLTQQKLNKKFEYPSFFIRNKFAYNVKILWNCSILSTFIPLSFVFMLFGLVFKYWAEKYFLVTKCSNLEPIGKYISKKMIYNFETATVLLALSQLTYRLIYFHASDSTTDYISVIIYIILALTIVFKCLPTRKINKILYHKLFNRISSLQSISEFDYDSLSNKIQFDYTTTNPVYVNFRTRHMDYSAKIDQHKVIETKLE